MAEDQNRSMIACWNRYDLDGLKKELELAEENITRQQDGNTNATTVSICSRDATPRPTLASVYHTTNVNICSRNSTPRPTLISDRQTDGSILGSKTLVADTMTEMSKDLLTLENSRNELQDLNGGCEENSETLSTFLHHSLEKLMHFPDMMPVVRISLELIQRLKNLQYENMRLKQMLNDPSRSQNCTCRGLLVDRSSFEEGRQNSVEIRLTESRLAAEDNSRRSCSNSEREETRMFPSCELETNATKTLCENDMESSNDRCEKESLFERETSPGRCGGKSSNGRCDGESLNGGIIETVVHNDRKIEWSKCDRESLHDNECDGGSEHDICDRGGSRDECHEENVLGEGDLQRQNGTCDTAREQEEGGERNNVSNDALPEESENDRKCEGVLASQDAVMLREYEEGVLKQNKNGMHLVSTAAAEAAAEIVAAAAAAASQRLDSSREAASLSQVDQKTASSYHSNSYHDLWQQMESSQLNNNGFNFSSHFSDLAGGNSSHGPALGPVDLSNGCKMESILDELDTLDVALKVREKLSFYNLGQRLFARFVLGLSQGTVSELLSKPKHWTKLTEKGRESYRKMHQWVQDETGVLMLKSLIQSSKYNSPTPVGSKLEDSATEERIAQILSDAQSEMKQKMNPADFEVTISTNNNYSSQDSFINTNHSMPTERSTKKHKNRRSKGDISSSSHGDGLKKKKSDSEGEHLTRDLISRIYQKELEKLALAAEASGNMAELRMYREELMRVTQKQLDSSEVTTDNKENCQEAKDCGLLKVETTRDSTMDMVPQDLSINGVTGHNASDVVAMRSKSVDSSRECNVSTASSTGVVGSSETLSPLQRMQSIANSLALQTSSNVSQSQHPSRPVLPPISQEQFDAYQDIRTDDLVYHVKDVLSQFSISQRLFGENVLGLSQGSVSDLLARPKPWSMLTQKGREPFIRMKMFLEDQESIPKLVATQYRVPPEKLLRSNSFSELPASAGLSPEDMTNEPEENISSAASNFHPPASGSMNDSALPFYSNATSAVSAAISCANVPMSPIVASSSTQLEKAFPPLSADSFPGRMAFSPLAMVPSMLSLFGAAAFLPPAHLAPMMMVDFHRMCSENSEHSPSGIVPASPIPQTGFPDQELDTQVVTSRVKEVLQVNNLGQKLFGEAVLELSQGSVSELLSKPKPWNLLSLKGREPFIKMHMWLADPLGVDRLRAFQNQASGRKRKSESELAPCERAGNPKKPRLFFTEEQKVALRQAYIQDPYPSQLAIEQLARDLEVGVKTVVNWFHNHRMRAKQQQNCCSPNSNNSADGSISNEQNLFVKTENSEDMSSGDCSQLMGGFDPATFPGEGAGRASLKLRLFSNNSENEGPDGENFQQTYVKDFKQDTVFSGGYNSVLNSDQKFSESDFKCDDQKYLLNKRKRAKPHRLFDKPSPGQPNLHDVYPQPDAIIDLSVNRKCPSSRTVDPCETTVQERESGNDICKEEWLEKKCMNAVNLNRLQEANQEEVVREKNIEKLQKNLQMEPADDWEF